MWNEILVDDDIGLQEYVDVWNNSICTTNLIDVNLLKRIINTKEDAHSYIYNGGVKIIMTYRHDISDNTTDIVHVNSNINYELQKNDASIENEVWDANRDFIKMLLEKYNRPVKCIKFGKITKTEEFDNRITSQAITKHAEWGIKATEFKYYWIYELM